MTDSAAFATLQQKLNYYFKNEALLERALTHTSFANEELQAISSADRSNERLEFLGDAVLGLGVSELLFETFASASEGDLTKMRARLVNEKTLSEIARSLGLSESLKLGKGETKSGGAEKNSILASALEAVIAAVFIDGGFQSSNAMLKTFFKPFVETEGALETPFRDFKTELQEKAQAAEKVTPTYHLVGETGPDHLKTFKIEVRFGARAVASALGSSKKQAEQNAAWAALQEAF